MNKALIYEVLENPDALSGLPIEELESLRDAYPWFSAAQVLLAKAYQLRDDHRFTDQLRHAALFTGNRRLFYEYIKTEKRPELRDQTQVSDTTPPQNSAIKAGPENAEDVVEMEIARVPVPESHLTTRTAHHTVASSSAPEDAGMAAASKTEGSADVSHRQIQHLADLTLESDLTGTSVSERLPPRPADPEVTKTISHEGRNDRSTAEVHSGASIQTTEGRPPANEKSAPRIDIRQMDLLDKSILAEAVSSSIQQEVSVWQDDQVEDVQLEPLPAAGEVDSDQPVTDSNTDDYSSWLLRRAQQLHYQDNEIKLPEASPSGTSEGIAPALPGLASAKRPATSMEVPDKNDQQRRLIDRFMRSDPKITPGKSAEYDTQNVARESLEEDFSLVTETMARLLVAQGKSDKARKVYRRLMELYPEKSVYFAAQLKNLTSPKKG
jgi:hypothetical protein